MNVVRECFKNQNQAAIALGLSNAYFSQLKTKDNFRPSAEVVLTLIRITGIRAEYFFDDTVPVTALNDFISPAKAISLQATAKTSESDPPPYITTLSHKPFCDINTVILSSLREQLVSMQRQIDELLKPEQINRST